MRADLTAQKCENERDERVEYYWMKHGFASLRPRSSHSRRSRDRKKWRQEIEKKGKEKCATSVTEKPLGGFEERTMGFECTREGKIGAA